MKNIRTGVRLRFFFLFFFLIHFAGGGGGGVEEGRDGGGEEVTCEIEYCGKVVEGKERNGG